MQMDKGVELKLVRQPRTGLADSGNKTLYKVQNPAEEMNLLHQWTLESGMWSQGSFYTSPIKCRLTNPLSLPIQVEAWWDSGKLEKLASRASLKKRKFGVLDYT